MEITKQVFIETQIPKMCNMCSKKARIIDAMHKELPDKAFLFEMQDKFHEILLKEG